MSAKPSSWRPHIAIKRMSSVYAAVRVSLTATAGTRVSSIVPSVSDKAREVAPGARIPMEAGSIVEGPELVASVEVARPHNTGAVCSRYRL